MSARPKWHSIGQSEAKKLLARARYDAQTHSHGRPDVEVAIYSKNLEQYVESLCSDSDFKETEGLSYFEVKHPRLGWISVGVEFFVDEDDPRPSPTFAVIEVRVGKENVFDDLNQDALLDIDTMTETAVQASICMDQERQAEDRSEA